MTDPFDGKRVLVLGLGVTGCDVARVAARHGATVMASDAGEVPVELQDVLSSLDIDVESGGHERAARELSTFDFVVPSPGITPRRGFLADVVSSGATVVSELDLAVQLTDAPVVAVTGTNGKTTVVRLAERIARAAGLDAYACGNTEVPFLLAADEHHDADLFVVEASSFRLHFCRTFAPRVAVITNLAADHLEWHGDMTHYRDAKARIAAQQTTDDLFVFAADQPELADMAPAGVRRSSFPDGREFPSVEWLQRAPHFADDASAAAIAMSDVGAGEDAIDSAVRDFTLDAHRLEPVGTVNGVSVIDDSVSTNPHAALAALRNFDRAVLIAGGRNKDLDLRPLATAAPRLRAVVALGEAADELVAVFAATEVPVKSVGTMDEAVAVAIDIAVAPDVILLSPACASKDMFTSYAHRGRVFREACLAHGVVA